MGKSAAATIALAIMTGPALAQTGSPVIVSYCEDLKQVAGLASAKDRFASVTGKLREGNFSDTTLPLTGWKDCSLYGAATYTCDSQHMPSADEAETAQAKIIDEILSCFAGYWFHVLDRSSPAYAVLHPAKGVASITLNIDETDNKEFVVRLNLFVRRN